jgi:endonuclease/exonuclease/phosphatase family metal-dependent hydrolase
VHRLTPDTINKKAINVITINTWKCDGDYYGRMNALLRQLKFINPDIIVCQECFKTADNTIDTIAYLAEGLNMDALFTPARFKKRKIGNGIWDSFSGLGILSRYPVELTEELDLPSNNEDGGRVAQFSKIKISRYNSLVIANIHLSFLAGAEELRIQQLHRILKRLQEYKEVDYKLVCGDFNCEIDSPEIISIKNTFNIVDCYSAGEGIEPRSSKISEDGYQLNKCVDHIFCLVEPTTDFPAFTKSEIILNQPDEESGIYPSDHFGISTTLIIP